jgi:hypothetical protein
MSFLDRRKYKKKLREMEDRLLIYEDNFISECEMKMVFPIINRLLMMFKKLMIYSIIIKVK